MVIWVQFMTQNPRPKLKNTGLGGKTEGWVIEPKEAKQLAVLLKSPNYSAQFQCAWYLYRITANHQTKSSFDNNIAMSKQWGYKNPMQTFAYLAKKNISL